MGVLISNLETTLPSSYNKLKIFGGIKNVGIIELIHSLVSEFFIGNELKN
jgi:hypothetical protein